MPKKHSRFYKIFPWLMGVIIGLIVLVVGLGIIYDLYFPNQPTTIKSVYITSPQVAGEPMTVHIKACKYTTKPSTLYRQLVSVGNGESVSYGFPVGHGLLTTGCHSSDVILSLPSDIPSGRYYLRDDASYQVNPIRTINVYSQSNIFTVVKN